MTEEAVSPGGLFLIEPLPDTLPIVSRDTGVAMWEMNGGRITTFGSGFIARDAAGVVEAYDGLEDAVRHIRGVRQNPDHPHWKRTDLG